MNITGGSITPETSIRETHLEYVHPGAALCAHLRDVVGVPASPTLPRDYTGKTPRLRVILGEGQTDGLSYTVPADVETLTGPARKAGRDEHVTLSMRVHAAMMSILDDALPDPGGGVVRVDMVTGPALPSEVGYDSDTIRRSVGAYTLHMTTQ